METYYDDCSNQNSYCLAFWRPCWVYGQSHLGLDGARRDHPGRHSPRYQGETAVRKAFGVGPSWYSAS